MKPKSPIKEKLLQCSFCGKTQNQVRKLIAGPAVYICNECLAICFEILSDDDPIWIEEQVDLNSEKVDTIIREITLPPDYHQVGLSILGYFSLILKYKYPDMLVKMRLELIGRIVRLVIRPGTQDKEKIQNLLNDYGLIIQGKISAEQFFEQPHFARELQERLKLTELEITRLLEYRGESESTFIDEKVKKLQNALGWILRQEIENIEELFA